MKELSRIDRELREYYRERRERFGPGPQGIGWKSAEAQATIFRQVTKIIEARSGFSIADLGCGLGHLYDFLRAEGYSDFRYAGYDILEEMVEAAASQHAGSGATFSRIGDASHIDAADYVVAAGIFNLKYSMPDDEWMAYVLRTLHAMNDRSGAGFAFNALTKYSDAEFMRPELHYSDPAFLFDYCKRHFARNVALLHDYTLYEFTILVRKRP